jgi:hypothetical protein
VTTRPTTATCCASPLRAHRPQSELPAS